MWPNMLENADLVTFTQEILNSKLQFLCSPTSAIFTWDGLTEDSSSEEFLGVSIDSKIYLWKTYEWSLQIEEF